jgi:crossover junction endonuclease EME1
VTNGRRNIMYLDRSFCMEKGQFKSGSDVQDTFSKMLQQITRVTPQVADSITGVYRSVHALVRAFQNGGPNILEDLEVRLTGSGAARGRRVGPALSRKIHDLFLNRDQFALA